MTIAQIITETKRIKNTSESDDNLIISLERIQKKIWLQLKGYDEAFGTYSVTEDVTVEDQLEYDLDSDCEWENIFYVKVGEDTDGNNYVEHKYAPEMRSIENGYYWQRITADKIALTQYGSAYGTDDLPIKIYYNPTPATITLTTQTPDLKANYHDLYIYALIQYIASMGDNPDIELTNYYKQEYYEFLEFVKADLSNKNTVLPYTLNQKQESW